MSEATDPKGGNNRPTGHDQWTVWDAERENARHFDDRPEAEAKKDALSNMVDLELFPPGESPEAMYHAEGNPETDATPESVTDETTDEPDRVAEVNDTSNVDAETVDHNADTVPVEDPDPQPVDADNEAMDQVEGYDLPDRSVSDDPMTWVPGEFVDTIDGSQAINRKGFEVLSHFYDVDLDPTLQVAPESTDHTYCRVRCVAEIDGRSVAAFGSAHVDRGDDPELLLEMAGTRARKRALSIATGVGAVAVAELKNEVEQ